MCEITESESVERRLESLTAEAERLTRQLQFTRADLAKESAERALAEEEVDRQEAEIMRLRERAERPARLVIFVPDWSDGTERWVFTGDFNKIPFAAMTKVITHKEAIAVLNRTIGLDTAPAGEGSG